jgi:hypothetical protein
LLFRFAIDLFLTGRILIAALLVKMKEDHLNFENPLLAQSKMYPIIRILTCAGMNRQVETLMDVV